MKAGSFNINDYLNRLYEEAEEKQKQTSTDFLDGGQDVVNVEGLVIPEVNKKSYDWLKSEFQKGKTEVKVEMKLGDTKFEPGYDLQTDLDSVKDFKPGMFGEIKTADTKGNKTNLDSKKDSSSFEKGEGENEGNAKKNEVAKTKVPKENIKNKEEIKSSQKHEAGESKGKEEKEEQCGVES